MYPRKLLKKLENDHKHFKSFGNPYDVYNLTSDGDSIRPDKQYFKNQLLEFISYLIKHYSIENKPLKKAWNKIKKN